MPQVFKVGSYWVYFWANENEPLEPIHVHVAQGHPTATPLRSGSPRRAAATCAIITLRSRPGYCATLWQLLKRAAGK